MVRLPSSPSMSLSLPGWIILLLRSSSISKALSHRYPTFVLPIVHRFDRVAHRYYPRTRSLHTSKAARDPHPRGMASLLNSPSTSTKLSTSLSLSLSRCRAVQAKARPSNSNHLGLTLHSHSHPQIDEVVDDGDGDNDSSLSTASRYGLWETDMNIQSFNMDLDAIANGPPTDAGSGPRRAQDMLEIMEDMHHDWLRRRRRQRQSGADAAGAECDDGDDDGEGDVSEGRDGSSLIGAAVRPLKPNAASYTTVIHGWVHAVGGKRGASGAQALLDRMERLSDEEKEAVMETSDNTTIASSSLRPNIVTYMNVVQGWAQCREAQRAEDVLRRMIRRSEGGIRVGDGGGGIRPDVQIYTLVLGAWARRSPTDPTAARRAEDLLEEMEEASSDGRGGDGNDGNGEGAIRPNAITYTTCISAWAKSGDLDAAERAEAILRRMEDLASRGGDPDARPDVYSYTAAVHAWANSSRRRRWEGDGDSSNSARRAQEIVDRMEKLAADEEEASRGNQPSIARGRVASIRPNAFTYTNLINAWARSGAKGAAGRCESILAKMDRIHGEVGDDADDIKPKTFTFNAVIHAHARSRESGSARRAERILVEMNHRYADLGDSDVKPNFHTYNNILLAWANTREDPLFGARRAHQILDQLEELYQRGETDVVPNAMIYTTVINAYANAASAQRRMRRRPRREQQHGVDPKDGDDAAERAEAILEKMHRLYEAGEERTKPTTVTYTSAIKAWAKSGLECAPTRAESILERMRTRSRSAPSSSARPNTMSYNEVLDAWSNSRGVSGSARRAEEILDEMILASTGGNEGACADVKPDTVSFNTVIKAWANSSEGDAAQRAEKILERMRNLSRDGILDVQPDIVTYNTVMMAWGNSGERGAPQQAELILDFLEQQQQQQQQQHSLKPDLFSYTSLINAWARSKEREKANRSRDILRRMVRQYKAGNKGVVPSVHMYTAVISACGFPHGSESDRLESLKTAMSLFEELDRCTYARPNSVTYSTLMKSVSNLMPADDSRDRVIEAIFSKCCRDGLVDDIVLAQLRTVASAELFQEIMNNKNSESTGRERMVQRWSRNVRSHRKVPLKSK